MKYKADDEVLIPARVLGKQDGADFIVSINGQTVNVKEKCMTDVGTIRLEGFSMAIEGLLKKLKGESDELPTVDELLHSRPKVGTA